MTKNEYMAKFGPEIDPDDYERATCDKVGRVGHLFCGMCETHNRPRFQCGCMFKRKIKAEHGSALTEFLFWLWLACMFAGSGWIMLRILFALPI